MNTYPRNQVLLRYLRKLVFVYFYSILQKRNTHTKQDGSNGKFKVGAKRNKSQIQQQLQHISNIQVFCIMLEKKTEGSPHSLPKKVKNIFKTA